MLLLYDDFIAFTIALTKPNSHTLRTTLNFIHETGFVRLEVTGTLHTSSYPSYYPHTLHISPIAFVLAPCPAGGWLHGCSPETYLSCHRVKKEWNYMQPSAVQCLQPHSHEFGLRALAQIQNCSKLHFGHQCNLDRKALNFQVPSSSVPILRGRLIIQY